MTIEGMTVAQATLAVASFSRRRGNFKKPWVLGFACALRGGSPDDCPWPYPTTGKRPHNSWTSGFRNAWHAGFECGLGTSGETPPHPPEPEPAQKKARGIFSPVGGSFRK